MNSKPSFPTIMDMEQLSSVMSCMQQLGVRLLDYTAPDGTHIVLRGAEPMSPDDSTLADCAPPPAPAPASSQLVASMHGVFYVAASPTEKP